MNILGQTAQDHCIDCISKTFKKLMLSRKKKRTTEPPESQNTEIPKWSKLRGFRQIPKLLFTPPPPPPINHLTFPHQ